MVCSKKASKKYRKESLVKTMVKKALGVVLVLLTALFCFSSCIDGSMLHIHIFRQKANEIKHFQECSCGKTKDSAEHTFEWIIDSEPTYTSPGYKHKECVVCTYKEEENTVVERLIHVDGFNDGLTVDFSNKETFVHKEDLIEFCAEKEIKYSFLCIDASSKPETGIYTMFSAFDGYAFYYEEKTENDYTSPYIVVSYDIYSNELGPTYDEPVDGVASAGFLMYFYAVNTSIDSYQFEFYKNNDPKSALNYVVQITSGDVCVGTVFYGTDVHISREWIADYLLRNLFVIN